MFNMQNSDDLYRNGVQLTVEIVKQFMRSPVGVFLYALVTGVVGIIILLAFLSMVFSASALPLILPVIIAFNSAAAGFSLIDKAAAEVGGRKLVLAVMALLLTIAGCTIITLFCPWEALFETSRYLISGLSALVFTAIGAWIGTKSKSLNRSS